MHQGREDERRHLFEGYEYDDKDRWDLYVAAAKDDWGKAEEIYERTTEYVQDCLTDVGDTALHVAVVARSNDFVEKLVRSKYMEKEDLEKPNNEGNTAFILAAMLGNIEVVLLMLEKNEKLVKIRNGENLPVQMAALLGHKEMVKCLYIRTKDHLNDDDRILLLLTLIDNDIYDVALSMVDQFPTLAVSREQVKAQKNDGNGKADANVEKPDEIGETALHALARKPLMTLNEFGNSKQGILKRFYCPSTKLAAVTNSNKVEKKKMHPKALELVRLLWEKIVNQRDYKGISELITKPSRLISDAAKQGNIDFLSFLISKHPALMFKVYENKYSILHTAVEYRDENIFNLICGAPSIKDVTVAMEVGKEGNNILHLAAKLPADLNRLNVVSGAALQMQLELWWFKEVSKLMPPYYAGAKNKNGETAQTLFTKEHKQLMKDGEEWMKTTANSCMIVATLIATIVFAAAFTLPGGVKGDTGAPHFLRKASFICFAIFDIISLVSSSCSILTFLSILTARYAEKDFLRSLPIKLLLGLLTLCISIISMMAVFCTTLFIVFDEGTIVPAILAVALAFILVIIFIWLQISLFLDVFFSLIMTCNISCWKAKYAFNTF
ncbi:hypothetical protein Dsin_028470 [Dipteronia sinensis]|uniref:PGG domain-containing protein n=1 Tax=Dipteronia sinensis TaxID=43782 RepID=A0AAD9ZR65_9ROSI|nr:hypothetical protein Dsin_028470 [Dipteronia sinensis]